MNITPLTPSCANLTPVQRHYVLVETSQYPLAEADDLLDMEMVDHFRGSGVYALEYRFSDRKWTGLRKLRESKRGVQIFEGGEWKSIPAKGPCQIRMVGFVHKVLRSRGEGHLIAASTKATDWNHIRGNQ